MLRKDSFRILSGDSSETMRKLCLSEKFPHQEIRWNYGILSSVRVGIFTSIRPMTTKFEKKIYLKKSLLNNTYVLQVINSIVPNHFLPPIHDYFHTRKLGEISVFYAV